MSKKKLFNRIFLLFLYSSVFILFALLFFVFKKATLLEESLTNEIDQYQVEDNINDKYNWNDKNNVLKKTDIIEVSPISIQLLANNKYIVNFSKAYFGAIHLTIESNQQITVSFFEIEKNKLHQHQNLPESIGQYIGFYKQDYKLPASKKSHYLDVPIRYRPTPKNLPKEINAVMPIKQLEITGFIGELRIEDIKLHAVIYPYDKEQFSFDSDNEALNRVIELSRHTSVATSFAGLFIDGDRERLPYEADAYIQFLSYAMLSNDYSRAKATMDYLLENPTWPTEWQLQFIFLAYEYFMYSGDTEYLRKIYPKLKLKLLSSLADNSGVITINSSNQTSDFLDDLNLSAPLKDIIDWPESERTEFKKQNSEQYFKKSIIYYLKYLRLVFLSNFDFPLSNREYTMELHTADLERYKVHEGSVAINLFRYSALIKLSKIACFLNYQEDCERYEQESKNLITTLRGTYFNAKDGLYSDISSSEHYSFHANLFALAFTDDSDDDILQYVLNKNLDCSVYAAQYLLEGLIRHNQENHAIKLITNKSDRGWLHMMDSLGATMTTEAWNFSVKPNMDLNHGWGTSPLNIAVRYVAGIRPIKPGFAKVLIEPKPGELKKLSVHTPTPHGEIKLDYQRDSIGNITLNVDIPKGVEADLVMPLSTESSYLLSVDGITHPMIDGKVQKTINLTSGHYSFEMKII